jgi:hypothetical protein
MSHDDDPSAQIRAEIIATGKVEEAWLRDHGPAWSTESLVADFEVLGYAAPFVVARRRVDGVMGSLMFTHQPRVYFGWAPDESDQK